MKFKIAATLALVIIIQNSFAQNVGIGTTTPQARLHVADSSVYFSSPDPLPSSTGTSSVVNNGVGLFWVAGKAALRVGRENGNRWAFNNVGAYSTGFGCNNLVKGEGGFASGASNTIDEAYSVALGSFNYAKNFGTLAFGNSSQALGIYSNAIGLGVTAQAFHSTAMGRYNLFSGDVTSDIQTDPIFVVGNGTSAANRSNALTILKNGNIGIGELEPWYPLQVKTTTNHIALYVTNDKIVPYSNVTGIFTYQNNIRGAAIEAVAAAPGASGLMYKNDVSYAVLGVAGDDRYGIGAFSTNKPAVLAKSVSGVAVKAETDNGVALYTRGPVILTLIGEAAGKVLVSDATGNASWQNPPTITLDQLSSSGKSEITFRNQGSYVGSFGWSQASTRFFVYDQNTGTNPLVIKNGRVGLGDRDATTNMLEVNGNASKSSAGSWLGNSDARLKKDIQPITSALQKLLQLKGITYQWNDPKTGIKRPEGTQMGFTAQNIQQVFPGEVSTDAQGYLQTAYGTYDALFVEAIKELMKKVEVLEAEISELKKNK